MWTFNLFFVVYKVDLQFHDWYTTMSVKILNLVPPLVFGFIQGHAVVSWITRRCHWPFWIMLIYANWKISCCKVLGVFLYSLLTYLITFIITFCICFMLYFRAGHEQVQAHINTVSYIATFQLTKLIMSINVNIRFHLHWIDCGTAKTWKAR